MSRSNVRYSREMRDDAIKSSRGLVTVEVVFPGKKPGKLGSRMTMQGPVSAAECAKASEFLVSLVKARQSKDS